MKARARRILAQAAALAATGLLGLATFAFVDLEPKVEEDFFFASGDPQVRENERIERLFGEAPQVFVRVEAPEIFASATLVRLRDLTAALEGVEGVDSARSLANAPKEPEDIGEKDPDRIRERLMKSPWWRRLLLSPDEDSAIVVLLLEDADDPAPSIRGIDRVLARFDAPGFRVAASGVPYVTEHVREELGRDLQTFSVAALACFAILVALLFRSVAIVVGTIAASLSACFLTFLVRAALGMSTGILTPNLWTIAFVLTLSHVVYLTVGYRRLARERGSRSALARTILLVGPPSAWSLVANLLGFASLMLVDAKPLREFGQSGAIAACAALACAYLIHPPFLLAARVPEGGPSPIARRFEGFFTRPHRWLAAGFVLLALALAPLLPSVDTDPSLSSYFARGGTIREGIEAIDEDGGSSPLELIVSDAGGATLASDDAFERLMALQLDLERHEDVGTVMSVALLMAETDRRWYSFLASWKRRLERLESPKHEEIGDSFVTDDRRQGRFILRMHERSRDRPRGEIVAELQGVVRSHGFEPVVTGGLYPLQGRLAELVKGSVVKGIGGLVAVFFLISLWISRSLRASLAMAACVALVPMALYGLVAALGRPLDIISAPAASLALPLGIDEMIHVGYSLRRSRRAGAAGRGDAWRKALAEMWLPTFGSMLIIVSGFMLFLLSRFPPTRTLGLLACIGGVLTDVAVLVVLPALGGMRKEKT